MTGSWMSIRIRSGFSLGELDALLPVDGLDQLVARRGQQVAQDGPVILLSSMTSMRLLMRRPPAARPDGQVELEGRPLAEFRFHPDLPAVHLDDLLGDGEPEAGPALGLGVGAVDLVELIEYAVRSSRRYPGTGIDHRDGEQPLRRWRRCAPRRVGELDGVADEIEQDLGEALLVAQPTGSSWQRRS